MRKCKECEKAWGVHTYKDFFRCLYCEELYCKTCHCPKECLKGVQLDIPGKASYTDSDMLLYICKLLTLQCKYTDKILSLLEDIESNTS